MDSLLKKNKDPSLSSFMSNFKEYDDAMKVGEAS